MSDKRKPNTTRFGQALGKNREGDIARADRSQMEIRSAVRMEPDGSTTYYKSRAGFPRYINEEAQRSGTIKLPRGITAYPIVPGEELTTWSKPVVMWFDHENEVWVIEHYNPEQTKRQVPNLPEADDILVQYWTDAEGNTCLRSDYDLWYGTSGSGKWYSRWSKKLLDAPNPYVIPFYNDAANERYMTAVAASESCFIADHDGNVLYEFKAFLAYNGELRPYNVHLPPSITTNAETVCFISRFTWGHANKSPGVDGDPVRRYRHGRINSKTLVGVVDTAGITTYGVLDVVQTASAGTDENIEGEVNIEGQFWYFDTSRGGGSGVGYLDCRPTNGSGSIIDPYNPIYYIPKHNTFSAGPMDAFGDLSFMWKGHQYRKNGFTLADTQNVVVGYVASGATTIPVRVDTVTSLDLQINADGYTYRVSPAIPDFSLFNLYNLMCYLGDTNQENVTRRISCNANDSIQIDVSIGDELITIFTHTGTGATAAEAIDEQTISGFYAPSYSYLWVEGDEGTTDKARWFGNNDVRPCTPPLTHPYPGDPIGVEYQAFPTISAVLDLYNPKYNTVWRPTGSYSPYAGTVSFDATTRTIVASDPQLRLFAWIEARCFSTCTFSSGENTWNISLASSKMNADFTVAYDFVVRFKGTEHRKALFSFTGNKIGPWDRQTIEDWLQWPWTNSLPGSINLVGPPRIFPETDKYDGIDAVFTHQGVTDILAGDVDADGNISCILSTRFRIADTDADKILGWYLINEPERGNEFSETYFYCPDLKPLVEENYYRVEFDNLGLRAWPDVIPPRDDLEISTDRRVTCYRV